MVSLSKAPCRRRHAGSLSLGRDIPAGKRQRVENITSPSSKTSSNQMGTQQRYQAIDKKELVC
jgi:hypothetical protein